MVSTAIICMVVALLALACGLTWLATAGQTLLPSIILDNRRISPIVVYPISLTIAVSAGALVMLLLRRQRSTLDHWLMVVAFVTIGELAFSGLLPTVRFSAGFYAGRVYSLITSSIVLIVLLEETTRLYAQVLRSNAMLQRERDNKLMNMEAMTASIAHEVRQPLTTISVLGATALQWLKRTPADIEACGSRWKAWSRLPTKQCRVQQHPGLVRKSAAGITFPQSEQLDCFLRPHHG